MIEKIVGLIVFIVPLIVGVFVGYNIGYDNGRINTLRKVKGEPEIENWKPKKYR
ncbi:hypothetical protein [Aneurinibacillus migulanus]|uniref:Uncharacterized protein n=1 Tax=Aneurinibacillus migulanus TaxID=47500 RepID=A0A1G8H5P4_ANEMI|nr:hypothetical protein [Aneurinibacillus migulanus]MED0891292.1 hypothetical protein [Aneurinibacillus migulanus]MED1614019.1 hypothetical protein [Aneurinibacillus migulanus]MED4727997.1 hypothetical protein [Aneurinibacillus migulanus]SDI01830.1 hypothetical protein SAMN04487909_101258 [Aneurinibacillus migulanus]